MTPFTDEEIDQAIEELVFLPRTDKNHPLAHLNKAVEEYQPVKLAAMEKKKAEEAKKAKEKEKAEKSEKEKEEEEDEWVLESEGMNVPKVHAYGGGLK
ncbi:hypothetical protein EJ03DRAFT_354558 [Teratosphaeria nubilosa]|uniref:Uncharacterized protein n=1 Tax=Teratosphaeria nubilosa TaxID=161662 RepID=A0A6G1KZL7_9PEZI|nr:hypothetical protein EJ03DRAFT_354558 [Teratosphaeria nubilosa]